MDDSNIWIPDNLAYDSEDLHQLIADMFGELPTRYGDLASTSDRAILTTTNAAIDEINQHVMDMFSRADLPQHRPSHR